jgi:hypothetical protein
MTLRKILFLISLLIIFGALFYKIWISFLNTKKIPNVALNDIKVLELVDQKTANNSALSLKTLSANLIAEFEPISTSPENSPARNASQSDADGQNSPNPESSLSSVLSPTSPPMKIKSLRVLGELINNGKKTVEDTTPIITFYDAENQKINDKVANFSDGYIFPKLKPNEKYFYDILIKDLPNGFQNLTIFFQASSSPAKALATAGLSTTLKLESRDIEENIATASSGGQNYYYYRVKGKMINTGSKSIKNAKVVSYAKDKNDRVFAWNSETFPSDLLNQNQRQQINILITPLKNDRAENFEVFFFGEEL